MMFSNFLSQEASRLAAFTRYWEYNNSKQPEHFPKDLSPGEWDEQYHAFEYDPGTHTCGETGFIKFSSMHKKMCNICDKVYPWDLKPGDIPVMGSSRLKSPKQMGES